MDKDDMCDFCKKEKKYNGWIRVSGGDVGEGCEFICDDCVKKKKKKLKEEGAKAVIEELEEFMILMETRTREGNDIFDFVQKLKQKHEVKNG